MDDVSSSFAPRRNRTGPFPVYRAGARRLGTLATTEAFPHSIKTEPKAFGPAILAESKTANGIKIVTKENGSPVRTRNEKIYLCFVSIRAATPQLQFFIHCRSGAHRMVPTVGILEVLCVRRQ
jgi:hypothetical protein